MMTRRSLAFLVCAALVPGLAHAQAPPALANPIASVLKGQFEGVMDLVVRAAEKMPEANYGFQPTPEVRTFGQLVGHIASGSYVLCSAALGEKVPQPSVDLKSTATSKADLQKVLQDSLDYCLRAYSVTDEQLAQAVPVRGVRVRAQALIFNAAENYEHYGNMVTYMRIKGLVPPSSERMSHEEAPAPKP